MALTAQHRKEYTFFAIALVLGILIKMFIQPVNGLTPAGISLIAVFIPTLVLWIFVGIGWPCFAAAIALAFLQVSPGNTVWQTIFANSTCTIIIAMMMITGVMVESGAMEYIAKWFISRPIVEGRPYVFLVLYALAIMVIGVVVFPVIMCVCLLPLVEQVALSIGYTKHDKFYKAMCLVTLWTATIMDNVWPFARPAALAIIAMFKSLGYDLTLFTWIKYGVPFGLISITIFILAIRFFYRPDMSKFIHFDDAALRAELKANPMSKRAKVSIVSVVLVIIMWFLPYLTAFPTVASFFSKAGGTTAAALMVLIMALMKDKGQPILDFGKALQGVGWGLVLFVGCIIYFAVNIGAEPFGIKLFLSNVIAPLTSGMSTMGLIFVGTCLACILSNFMSNTVSATVLAAIAAPLMLQRGESLTLIFAACIAIACGAHLAYLTYAASPGVPVCVNDDGISIKEATPNNIVAIIGGIIGIMLVVPIFLLIA